MDIESKQRELQALQDRVALLEQEMGRMSSSSVWTPPRFYVAYEIMGGMVLGLIGAAASLLFNVIGSLMTGRHPLEIIRVYLTFPMGEKALTLQSDFALAAGVCLYLLTGMIGGVPIHMILGRYFKDASGGVRFLVATVLGIGVWLVNFYGVLYWLQPQLIGGRWIVERIPVLVAVSTHLVFAWTMLGVHRLGQFVPYDTRHAPASNAPMRGATP